MAPTDRKSLEERHAALARFNAWADAHPIQLAPADAVSAAGRLYELLPESARTRPIDCEGIITMHRLLARLGRG